MIGIIKVLVGLGVTFPVAGAVGGTYFVTTKSTVSLQTSQSLSSQVLFPAVSNSIDNPQSTHHGTKQDLQEIQTPLGLDTSVAHIPAPQVNSETNIQEQVIKEEITGNCTIIDPLNNILAITGEEYYSVSCVGKGKESTKEYDTISNKWEGAFPKSIFKQKDWSKNQKLEISLKEEEDDTFSDFSSDEEEEYPYKIYFSSKQFVDTIDSFFTGKWKYLNDFGSTDKTAAVVKLTHQAENIRDIYLLWTIE